MQSNIYKLCFVLVAFFSIVMIAGCGDNAPEKKDKGFFTSGNREADQRAEQRMAQQEQLTGNNTASPGVP